MTRTRTSTLDSTSTPTLDSTSTLSSLISHRLRARGVSCSVPPPFYCLVVSGHLNPPLPHTQTHTHRPRPPTPRATPPPPPPPRPPPPRRPNAHHTLHFAPLDRPQFLCWLTANRPRGFLGITILILCFYAFSHFKARAWITHRDS